MGVGLLPSVGAAAGTTWAVLLGLGLTVAGLVMLRASFVVPAVPPYELEDES